MSKREYFLRFLNIIKKLRNSREATFDEINSYLKRESEIYGDNLSISKRTFQRDLNEIRSIFSVDIKCNDDNAYYIADDGQGDLNNRMLEAFNMFNSLNMSNDLSRYVHFEKRKPQGTEHFYGLLHAIKNTLVIHFTYQKFWEDVSSQRVVESYSLKEFKGRWYLLGKDRTDEKIKTFGLDRIHDLVIERNKFSYPKDLDVGELFRHCFGIINPEDKRPEEIILSFDEEQGKYVKSFPLHESQTEIVNSKDEYRIKLNLKITYDFIMELLSYGETMIVLSPPKLKKEIRNAHKSAMKQYD